MRRGVLGFLGVVLLAGHLIAGLWGVASGLDDWAGWLSPFGRAATSLADDIAMVRAAESGFVLGSLSLLGAAARLLGALLTVLALVWGLGGGRVRAVVCLMFAFGLHLAAVGGSATQLVMAGMLDRQILAAWWYEAGWYGMASTLNSSYEFLWVGWHALALILHGGLAMMMAAWAVRIGRPEPS